MISRGLKGSPQQGFTFTCIWFIDNKKVPVSQVIGPARKRGNNNIKCILVWEGKKYKIHGSRGGTAIWLPMGNGYGLKLIIYCNDKQLENMAYLQKTKPPIFPEIDWAAIGRMEEGVEKFPCMIVRMTALSDWKTRINFFKKKSMAHRIVSKFQILSGKYMSKKSIPKELKKQIPGLGSVLSCSLDSIESCATELARWKLQPSDDWSKPKNLIRKQIVDFHFFKYMPESYAFPISKNKIPLLNKLYQSRLDSGQASLLSQGFRFSNDYCMPGISSNNKIYNSYRQLPFLPLIMCTNNKVLDLGCREGFLSFQAVIHGAAKVTAIDQDLNNIDFAKKINQICFQFNQIHFREADIESFILEYNRHKFFVTFLLSVLHKIYPNMKGAGQFLSKLASISKRTAFETPICHPQMSIGIKKIYAILNEHFKSVRFLYIYKKKSLDYRAIFLCYGL